jgi:hypothetical protein
VELLAVVEIDAENKLAAHIAFDSDDVDAAFAELDARYAAGEAAAYAHTWSVITQSYSESNRHELPGMTADSVFVDRRPVVTSEAEDLAAYLGAVWDLAPDIGVHIEAVHRLSDLGGVITHVARGTSRGGFVAEWRTINIFTVEGDLMNRVEVFDEADLDAALARFGELHQQARRLENAASRVEKRYEACFVARDWVAMAEILTNDTVMDDRRRVVGIGVRHGRDVQIADLTGGAKLGITSLSSAVIATRGERLVLSRGRFGVRGQRPEEFYSEVLLVVEIDTDERIAARVMFEPDDFDAAITELDARYLAGEAAAHADTWSVIAEAHARFNRQELPPTTPDPVYIDHRPVVSIEASHLAATVRAVWDITPEVGVHIEAVHRLSELGGVITHVAHGTSQEGFVAEWRTLAIFTIEGDVYNRIEVFDETDLDAALARFEELHPQTPRLENAASRTYARLWKHFMAHDWAALAETLADDIIHEDHRRVVGPRNPPRPQC